MMNAVSSLLVDLFTTRFGPRKAEAYASEITKVAAKLGTGTFKRALEAIGDGALLHQQGSWERTLLLIVEGIFDHNGNRCEARDFARRISDVLACVPSEEIQGTLEEACGRLRIAAYPRTSRPLSRKVRACLPL